MNDYFIQGVIEKCAEAGVPPQVVLEKLAGGLRGARPIGRPRKVRGKTDSYWNPNPIDMARSFGGGALAGSGDVLSKLPLLRRLGEPMFRLGRDMIPTQPYIAGSSIATNPLAGLMGYGVGAGGTALSPIAALLSLFGGGE